jgi:hypothetical protein
VYPDFDQIRHHRLLGAMFLMGFEGTTVTPHIRSLIEDYRLGAVLLNARNFVCMLKPPSQMRARAIVAVH